MSSAGTKMRPSLACRQHAPQVKQSSSGSVFMAA
jgi:hypothetical protein